MEMSFPYPSAGIICVCLSALSILILSRRQRKGAMDRMPSWLEHLVPAWLAGASWKDRRSASQTPSESPFSSKKIPSNVPLPANYKDIFPPSMRENLPKAAESLPEKRRKFVSGHSVNEIEFKANIIPFTADGQEFVSTFYTPTQISIGEVKALGDFPDYATLSGVPLPEPYKDFDIRKAITRPYRPLRWPYHQNMSLTKMEPDWWLELESTYVQRIKEREDLYEKHGRLVLQYLPGSDLACKEIMEHALQFLCARYPQYFSLTYTETKGYVLKNEILKNETIIKDMHPLHVLLHNVPEDFAVMLRNPEDGFYYFRAGLLCSSLGWNVDTKIGMQLKEIHQPIPDYKEKMEFSMDRYFSKLPTNKPIQRGSWGLEVDKPLFMPPGDPHEKYRDVQAPDVTLDRVHLRVDWQTLRRLPLSGAIIFNFKGLFWPLEELKDEPYVPALVAKVLEAGKPNLMEYKATWHVEHVALPALAQWAREQEEKGLVKKDWQVETLDETPYFPGWEDKWHRQQGF